MNDKYPSALLEEMLKNAKSNAEIEGLLNEPALQPKYDLNLKDTTEFNSVGRLLDYLRKGGVRNETVPFIEPSILANVFYMDVCDRQADAIASDLLANDELGSDYYISIFLKLVENYNGAWEDLSTALAKEMPAVTASQMLSQARDIVFVQRFHAFSRYDRWDISDPENKEIRASPKRAMLELLNNDLCAGAFWDPDSGLKNRFVQERIQGVIDAVEAQEQRAPDGGFSGKNTKWFSAVPAEASSEAMERLSRIAKGKRSEFGAYAFKYDEKKFESGLKTIFSTKSPTMSDIAGFVEKSGTSESKSLNELVTELQKLKGPKQSGAVVK